MLIIIHNFSRYSPIMGDHVINGRLGGGARPSQPTLSVFGSVQSASPSYLRRGSSLTPQVGGASALGCDINLCQDLLK